MFIRDKAVEAAPHIQILLPDEKYPEINCTFYGHGCKSGMRMKMNELLLVAIEFDSEDHAKRAAIKFDGYYKKNWFFDEISNEPILQDFVIKVYGAVRARTELEKQKEKINN